MKVVPLVRRVGVAALLLWGVGAVASAAVTSSPGHDVIVVPISGPVDAGTTDLIRRSVDLAESRSAAAIVLDVGNANGSFASS
jgi:membrane-bound ClpP family serine protease